MSSQSRSSSAARPSGGYSGQVSRSGSNTRSSGSATQARPTNPSSGSVSRQTAPTRSSGTTVRQQRLPATGSTGSTGSVSGTQARPSTGQPVRGGSNTRSSNTTSGTVARSQQSNQPAGSVNRNQPQAGMSADRSAPGTVRSRTNAPRNYSGSSAPREVRMRPGPGRNIERIPPRHRDPMPFNRAVRFWDGGHHYFGYRVSYLPARYVREVYWGVPYYVLDGIYYRHYAGHYYICRPPFGVYFDPVLDNLAYSVCRFAYYYDVYNTYRTINENAQTIASQNATIAANNATIQNMIFSPSCVMTLRCVLTLSRRSWMVLLFPLTLSACASWSMRRALTAEPCLRLLLASSMRSSAYSMMGELTGWKVSPRMYPV